MKRCPTCNKTFTDRNLSFCIDDGTPLVEIADSTDETTVVSPQSGKGAGRSDEAAYVPRDWQKDYQPPGSFEPPGQKRRVWPWVVAIVGALLIGIVGLGVAFAFLMPRMLRASRNGNSSNVNISQQNSNTNFNAIPPESNSNRSDVNENDKVDENAPTAPTDSNQVLADLTSIEHEWTVANINADKKKLAWILADDYVGTAGDGRTQGKAEYLKTIERDSSIEKWEFEDLKVVLRGDRATLNGRIRLQVAGDEAVYRFVDKFVWRDGRWQAVGSEVAAEKQ
jgi:uncharacterized protein DUF4440